MTRLWVAALLAAALCCAACGADEDSKESGQDVAASADSTTAEDVSGTEVVPEEDLATPEDVPAGETAAANKAFGEACVAPEECESGVCHEFGSGGSLCTITCETEEACPEGTEGKKCNKKGVCKP